MVYILVVVALFAALSLVLARGTDTSEAGSIPAEKIDIYAGQIMQTPMQLKQAIDQMVFTGAAVDQLDFTEPGGIGFDLGGHSLKVFHPEGGGISVPRLAPEVVAQNSVDPRPRWYLGRFNNVGWTPGAADDVILTAHQIAREVCARINEKLTGDPAIPQMTSTARLLLVDTAHSTLGAGNNDDFTAAECAACEGKPALCVKDAVADLWSYYSILSPQ